jgi:hypothetical protein
MVCLVYVSYLVLVLMSGIGPNWAYETLYVLNKIKPIDYDLKHNNYIIYSLHFFNQSYLTCRIVIYATGIIINEDYEAWTADRHETLIYCLLFTLCPSS